MSGPKPRACGCKGIRSCRLCMTTFDVYSKQDSTQRTRFYYCINCKKACHIEDTSLQESSDFWHQTTEKEQKNLTFIESQSSSEAETYPAKHENSSGDNCCPNSVGTEQSKCTFNRPLDSNVHCKVNDCAAPKTVCRHTTESQMIDFDGILVVENFVTEEEEAFLNTAITNTNFANSQSGRKKQDYGPKVNFKKQKVRTANFTGLPSYSHFLYNRMKAHSFLSDFEPVELCNLEYCKERGAHIEAHFDDEWLWGERLVTLNLLSDSTLTFTLDSNPNVEVRVPLFQRSLIVVSSAARYKWKHSILPEDIGERRIAMTFRELSPEFSIGGIREHEGIKLLKLALTFEGCAVSS